MSEPVLRAGNLDLRASSLTGDTPWQAGDEVVARIDRVDGPIITARSNLPRVRYEPSSRLK